MAISLILLPAILISLPFAVVEATALDTSVQSGTASICADQQDQKSISCELKELKLKVARLGIFQYESGIPVIV